MLPKRHILEAPFNADMLVSAREGEGLSQSALAEMLDVTQGTLSKIENKQLPPTRALLERAAAALNCRVSYFHRWPKHRNLPLTFYRKRVKVSATTLKRIHAHVVRTRIEMEALLRSADVPENRVPAIELKAPRMTPTQAARELRLRWHLPPGPVENMTEVLEDSGVIVIFQDFDTDMLSGLTSYEPTDPLPPVVFINSQCPPDRVRFTLAHELGHIALHHHLALPPEESEQEADDFAAEFLMPTSDIQGFLGHSFSLQDAAALKKTWKVSMAALVQRAFDLGRISPSRFRKLRIELGQFGWRKREPVDLSPEVPSLFAELVQAHLEDLGYSHEELSEALDMPTERLRTEYLGLRPGLRRIK